MVGVELQQNYKPDIFDDSVGKHTNNTLRVKQYAISGSGYARRIKEEEWSRFRDAIDELETEGCSRRDILRVLHANYGFFPTYGQLNARMTLWQRSRRPNDMSQVPSTAMEGHLSDATSRPIVMDAGSKAATEMEWSFVELPSKDFLMGTIPTLAMNGNQTADDLGFETTLLEPLLSEQHPEAPDPSEAETMSNCSSGSSDFRHFHRYAAALKDEAPAATCHTHRTLRSSNSSHPSWGFEEVTGLPTASKPENEAKYPFHRIRSGVVLGEMLTSTEIRSRLKPRTVVVHQPSGAVYDTPRTSDMNAGRWR